MKTPNPCTRQQLHNGIELCLRRLHRGHIFLFALPGREVGGWLVVGWWWVGGGLGSVRFGWVGGIIIVFGGGVVIVVVVVVVDVEQLHLSLCFPL